MANKSNNRSDIDMNFAVWLEKEMRKRGISQAELARQANVARATINGILKGVRGPGPDSIRGIAKAFKMPPETVYREAGMLPPATEADEIDAQILADLEDMHPDDKKEIAQYTRFKREQADMKKRQSGASSTLD